VREEVPHFSYGSFGETYEQEDLLLVPVNEISLLNFVRLGSGMLQGAMSFAGPFSRSRRLLLLLQFGAC
jgi:hypothetical protein